MEITFNSAIDWIMDIARRLSKGVQVSSEYNIIYPE